MATYVRGANPLWYFPDLVGQPLDDTYYAFFLTNTLPYVPQNVFHDSTGTVAWDNPIEFSPAGTLPIDMYFDDSLVYRIEIRQGNTQGDPLIWLIENYIPGEGDAPSPPTGITIATDNQISNPQFAELLFPDDNTLSATSVTDVTVAVAPGWDFVGTGTGNYSITRNSIPADENIATNAPYSLSVTLSGAWSSAYLRQRFNNTAGIWASNDDERHYVSCSVTARANDGAPYSISGNLVRDDGQDLLLFQVFLNSAYTTIPGSEEVPSASSSTDPEDSWTEFRIKFPAVCSISLTSIQLVGQDADAELPYDQDTIERQKDHLFHYYEEPLINKQIPNCLTAWDFPLNPAQFGTNFTVTATPAYAWDQTICQRVTANVAGTENAITKGIQFTTASNTEAFFLMQYLSGLQVKKLLTNRYAVNVSAWRTSAGGDATVRVYLFRGTPAAVIPTLPALIGSLDNGGIFTKNNTAGQGLNWTEIARNDNRGVANYVLPVITSNDQLNGDIDQMFNGWEITDATEIANTDKFCIIVTVQAPTTGTVITFNSICLACGDLATRPAMQTAEQVLTDCEYYWETTFLPGVTAPSATLDGAITAQMTSFYNGVTLNASYPQTFGGNWHTEKRAAPTTVIYSGLSTTASRVESNLLSQIVGLTTNERTLGTFWSTTTFTQKGFRVIAAVSGGALENTGAVPGITHPGSAYIKYHYIADARLGIV